jgi:aminoglycoside phosphotransferase family enzyme/predicted kinase
VNAIARRRAPEMPLFAALQRPECYPHPVGEVRVIETHISWVLLTGTYAYKIKKPVNLGFADFSTLGLRGHYCQEEVRLNRRFAPDLYLEVVEIRGTREAPRVGGEGPLLDYAVKMRQFRQDALAGNLLGREQLGAAEIDALAEGIAKFHATAPVAKASGRLGSSSTIGEQALQNFEQMLPLVKAAPDDRLLRAARHWTEREFAVRRGALAARRRRGFVRECHGDLHLANIVVLDGRPVPFDCLEFNEELRWIDVMSEVAFLFMDLAHRGRGDLAWRLLNQYLAATGDYEGLEVFRFYAVYRAVVRAKVRLIESVQRQQLVPARQRRKGAFREYLALAEKLSQPPAPALVIAHGLSGSGKTTATLSLAERLGAIRLRSDIERKRLHGLAALSSSGSGIATGIYTREANAATYRRLGELAGPILGAGFSVVVDAAFLGRAEREAFRLLAEAAGVPFAILDIHAPLDVLRARVAERSARADDASEAGLAVLERQIAAREPLTPAEMAVAVALDGTGPVSAGTWEPVRRSLRQPAVRMPAVRRPDHLDESRRG